MGSDKARFRVTTGHPLDGPTREYKTETGARRAAGRHAAKGERVTIWKGTFRRWGGWSWSTIPLEVEV